MRTSRIFWSLLLLFLESYRCCAGAGRPRFARCRDDRSADRADGRRQLAGCRRAGVGRRQYGLYQFGLSSGDRCLPAVDPAGLCVRQTLLQSGQRLLQGGALRQGDSLLQPRAAARSRRCGHPPNLDVANTFTKDKIAVVPEFFLKGWVRSAHALGALRGASSRWRRWRCSSRSCCFTCWPEGWRGARRVSTVRWRCCSSSSPPPRSP